MRKSRLVTVSFARSANDFCSAWDGFCPPASPIGSPPCSWSESAPTVAAWTKGGRSRVWAIERTTGLWLAQPPVGWTIEREVMSGLVADFGVITVMDEGVG